MNTFAVEMARKFVPVHVREIQVVVDAPQLSSNTPERWVQLVTQVDYEDWVVARDGEIIYDEEHLCVVFLKQRQAAQLLPLHAVKLRFVDNMNVGPEALGILLRHRGLGPLPEGLIREVSPHQQ